MKKQAKLRVEALPVGYRTSCISGGGGGRLSCPALTPALELPDATLADTHLKKPEKAVESRVSRATT
jgi:hypothetical protein